MPVQAAKGGSVQVAKAWIRVVAKSGKSASSIGWVSVSSKTIGQFKLQIAKGRGVQVAKCASVF